jgi:hypothetical protein
MLITRAVDIWIAIISSEITCAFGTVNSGTSRLPRALPRRARGDGMRRFGSPSTPFQAKRFGLLLPERARLATWSSPVLIALVVLLWGATFRVGLVRKESRRNVK